MDPRLDELISAAAPPLAQRTPELQHGLYALVADAEAAAVPSRRRLGRRIGAVSLAAVAVLGVGAAAGAAGLIPTPSSGSWFTEPSARHQEVVLSFGSRCKVTYAAVPQEVWEGRPVSPADQAAAMSVVQEFLSDFDLATISVDDAVKKYEAASNAARADLERRLPPEEIPPKQTSDEVKVAAVGAELYERLSSELQRQGLSPHAVTMASSDTCGHGSGL